MIINLLGDTKGFVRMTAGDNLHDKMRLIIEDKGVYILRSQENKQSYIVNYIK